MCVTVRTLCLLVSSVSVILSVARAVIHYMLHLMVRQGCDPFKIIPQSRQMVMTSVPHLDTPHRTTPPPPPPTLIKHDKWNTGAQETMFMHVTFHNGLTPQTNIQHFTKSHTGIGNQLCLRSQTLPILVQFQK